MLSSSIEEGLITRGEGSVEMKGNAQYKNGNVIREFVKILQPFEDATEPISGKIFHSFEVHLNET